MSQATVSCPLLPPQSESRFDQKFTLLCWPFHRPRTGPPRSEPTRVNRTPGPAGPQRAAASVSVAPARPSDTGTAHCEDRRRDGRECCTVRASAQRRHRPWALVVLVPACRTAEGMGIPAHRQTAWCGLECRCSVSLRRPGLVTRLRWALRMGRL